MRRKILVGLLILGDVVNAALAPLLALFTRLDGSIDSLFYGNLLSVEPIIIIVNLIIFGFFGMYNCLWRYASINELILIMLAVTTSWILLGSGLMLGNIALPHSIPFISWLVTIVLIGGSRVAIRILYHFTLYQGRKVCSLSNVLIVGAGDTGAMIAKEIHQRQYEEKKVVGFIDDSSYKMKQSLLGIRVLGNRFDIPNIIDNYNIQEVIIAMPSADSSVIRDIILSCKSKKCSVRTIPGIYELLDGIKPMQQLREVDLEDLLRRDPINLDLKQIAHYLKGKRVLVTGAGGSIGSELCRQIAKMSPDLLLLLGKGENSIYELNNELRGKRPDIKTEPIIADTRDAIRINEIFARYRPQVVFHAAAHKHVPLMESQPAEAIQNNVFGTKTVAEATDKFGAEIFVMISTDKAVNPTSIMGATKRIAELIIRNMNRKSKTKFVAVRFGNVLGSRGSVVPLFKKQIASGGPVTITHPDMRRYFMTIPEASQLVLQAGSMAQGGEVFVLDMGEPVKILDMACDLIKLSGLRPYEDIKIKYVGLRPGEKMFEELLTAEEGTQASKHKKIFVANLNTVDEEQLLFGLAELKDMVDDKKIIEAVVKLVPSYHRIADKQVKNKELRTSSVEVMEEKHSEPSTKYQPATSG
ncbi:MAG: polysaccharide biosynthesis protein [Pelosinus sp.]|nr:polysaccharide biosynthesis protein [Pelosinus sp.]